MDSEPTTEKAIIEILPKLNASNRRLLYNVAVAMLEAHEARAKSIVRLGPITDERLLGVISRVNMRGNRATFREMVRHTNWPKDSVQNLLTSLEQRKVIIKQLTPSRRTFWYSIAE